MPKGVYKRSNGTKVVATKQTANPKLVDQAYESGYAAGLKAQNDAIKRLQEQHMQMELRLLHAFFDMACKHFDL